MEMKNLIKTKISQYLSKEISKEVLYKWALEVLHRMLKGDIFNISNIEMWSIITGLAEVDDIDDSYCNELVRRFDRILSGDENASFVFFTQIPKKFVANHLSQTKNILLKYSTEKHLSRAEILELKLITNKSLNNPNTLNEVLELQILDLLKLGYDFYDDEESVNFNLKSTVFVSEDTSLETNFLAKIITLLECYGGEKGFCVHVSFNNGIGNVSIQA